MENSLIVDMLKRETPVFSVEFFPAKTEEGARQILRTAKRLQAYQPDFVSITYGAGGGTRQRTLEYGELLKDLFGYEVMPHLTCVGHSRSELKEILDRFEGMGFHNIMALRGDPPKGESNFQVHPDGFAYGSELVAFIRESHPGFCLGVGGYPEKHPEASSLEADLDHLKTKVNAGADFITTQLFFDNADFFRFEAACRARGIEVPIVPGILPALSLEQVTRFCGFCGSRLPEALAERLRAVEGDAEASEHVGVEWAREQIEALLARGAPGFHLYILNRSSSTIQLLEQLEQRGMSRSG